MKKKIVPFILSIILLQSISMPVVATTESELKDKKSEIEDKKDEAEEKKDQVEEQIDQENKEISQLDSEISESQAQIANLEMKIADLQNSIETKTKELEQKQKEHDENQALMEERMVVMYETGETTFLDMLFSSENIIDFISNYYMVSQITQCDKELLETIEKEQETIEQTKKELENEKVQVDSTKKQKETEANLLQTKKAERQEKVNNLTDTQKALQSEIEEYKEKMDALDVEIEKAIKAAMEQEKKNNSNSNSTGGSAGSTGGSAGSTGSKFDGTFMWPLDYSPKRVTSRMKARWGRWHKGIDIGTNAEEGKRVVASASGTVVYSAYQGGSSSSPGYGNYLIIYHGNGYASLYAHMQSKAVGSGTYVEKGQTIGYSGSTGGVAPHLHFEIRKASSVGNFFGVNNWLDPLDYLPGGYTIVD